MLELGSPEARAYLAERLGTPAAGLRLTELGGGVSNLVYLVEAPGLRCVAKQALAKLRVEQDWFCTPERIFRECEAIRRLQGVLPAGSVPEIVFEDRENYTFAMTAAADGAEPWKTQLLRGEMEEGTARAVGRILAALTGVKDEKGGWRQAFGDLAVFVDLRVDPYYRSTATRHPDLKQWYGTLLDECLARRVSLVHGDYSPKNLLVSGGRVLLIDFEVVHFGDPAFDAAFLTNHLLLKAFYRPDRAGRLRVLAREFWGALRSGLGGEFGWLEDAAVRHVGGLLLARIDGKSPAEYIQDPVLKDRVRAAARAVIAERPRTVDEIFEVNFR